MVKTIAVIFRYAIGNYRTEFMFSFAIGTSMSATGALYLVMAHPVKGSLRNYSQFKEY